MYKSFGHNGQLGDIIYSIPSIISQGGGDVYIKNSFYNTIKSFLLTQDSILNVYSIMELKRHFANREYIVQLQDGIEVINLDKYRHIERKYHINNNHQHLAKCHLEIFGSKFDLDKPWISNIELKITTPIVVNRSLRYHDKENIDWSLLKPYKEFVTFIGFEKQYKHFVFYAGFEPKCMKCENVLELAQVIKGSKLFIGNQSLCFALAEGMKVSRVLEVYHIRPNCNPSGKDGYTYLNNDIIKKYITEGYDG